MKLSKIWFDNYRNLSGVTLFFDTSCNFFVGENSIGKSNALDCIVSVFEKKNFLPTDFYDTNLPIVVQIELEYKENQNNHKSKKISLKIKQYYGESITYYHDETPCDINILDQLKAVFVDDDISLIEEEINHFSANEKDKFIKLFNNLDIVKRSQVFGTDRLENFFSEKGAGSNYSFYILKIIFRILQKIKFSKLDNYECLLLLDQPETNLHPFAQKTLVKDLLKLSCGQDLGFNRLIEQFFGVKNFSCQLFLVSHSDRILGSDFSKIIRFYRENGRVWAVSGKTVSEQLNKNLAIEKQVTMQFPYFSLAIFSKCVILIEGASEYGAMEYFAEKLGVDLDYLGISIISANGEGNIPTLSKLLRAFKIKVFSIKDRDSYDRATGDEYCTDKIDFEDEVVSNAGKDIMLKILQGAGIDYKRAEIPASVLTKRNYRYRVTNRRITKSATIKDCNLSESIRKLFCLSLLCSNKSVLTGASVGKYLPKEQIPPVYAKVLIDAKQFVMKS